MPMLTGAPLPQAPDLLPFFHPGTSRLSELREIGVELYPS